MMYSTKSNKKAYVGKHFWLTNTWYHSNMPFKFNKQTQIITVDGGALLPILFFKVEFETDKRTIKNFKYIATAHL